MEQYIKKAPVVAEIKRILSAFENSDAPVDRLRASTLIRLLSFIDTIEVKKVGEEPVSEDLEEAVWLHYDKNKPLMPPELDLHKEFIDFFKAGAEWQKDRIMWNAIDATCFGFQGAALFYFRLPAGNYLVGSKVKVIVIKEERI